MSLVQAPETAKFDGMPSNAIAAGMADHILAPEDMPATLLAYMNHGYVAAPAAIEAASPDGKATLEQVLELLRSRGGHDFRSYKRSTLQRRVHRRMGLRNIATLGEYLDVLKDNPDEMATLVGDLMISVTGFLMISIIDWRLAQCAKLGVAVRYNSWAEADTVTAEKPDAVVIATGGLPHTEVLRSGNELVVSSWDIISGDVKPGANVLVYDDAGDPAALQAAEIIANAGARDEIMTPDRAFSPEVMAMNLVPFMRALQKLDTTFTVTYRLEAVERSGNQLLAHIGSDYGGVAKQRSFDQIVVNHGTRPLDDLYFELKPHSSNLGEVAYEALIDGQPQEIARNPAGEFQLFRIGDAVAARNTHAAIYDALRLARTL